MDKEIEKSEKKELTEKAKQLKMILEKKEKKEKLTTEDLIFLKKLELEKLQAKGRAEELQKKKKWIDEIIKVIKPSIEDKYSPNNDNIKLATYIIDTINEYNSSIQINEKKHLTRNKSGNLIRLDRVVRKMKQEELKTAELKEELKELENGKY